MTDAEWLVCKSPTKMLARLEGRASDRKLRLFARACCRRVWDLIPRSRDRRVIEAAEAYADGEVTWQQLRRLASQAGHPASLTASREPADFRLAATATAGFAARRAYEKVFEILALPENVDDHPLVRELHLRPSSLFDPRDAYLNAESYEKKQQAAALRDLVGNPFRPPPAVAETWLSAGGGTVPKLAHTIYADRAFDRLPILADALEDAGCTEPAILSHCRSGGEHVRGCWVVDLLLGKS
jgi:hypothetical protein